MGEISENALHGIIAGLQLAGQRKARVQQAQLEREKLAQESEIERQRREARAKEHQDIVTHQNAQLDLAKATHKVMALKERSDILKGHVEHGLPLTPGSGMSSVGTEGGMETIRQEGEPSATAVGNVPFTDVQVPTQQAFAQRAAQSLMELNKPKIELEHKRAMDVLDRQLQVEEARAKDAQTKAESLEDYRSAREKENIALRNSGALNIEKLRGINRLAVAATRLKTGAQVNPALVSNDVNNIGNGTVTLDEVRKMSPTKEHLSAVLSAANIAGYKFLDPKQKLAVDAFTPAFDAIPLMDEFLEKLQQHQVKGREGVLGVGTPEYEELSNLQKQIKENLSSAQTMIVKSGRATDKRIAQMHDAYEPLLRQGVPANLQKVQKYRDLINKISTSAIATLSPEQQDAIKQRWSKLTGATPEATPISQPPNQPPEGFVKVKHKATGKVGYMPPNYNPSTYVEVKP